jgi:hypothetical protein
VSNPAALTLAEYPENVTIANVVNTVTVTSVYQPVYVNGGGGGQGVAYNQSLNTGDEVAFQSVTTPTLNGGVNTPIYFETGISTQNYGTTFVGSVDFGNLNNAYITNQLSLLFSFLPLDFGTASNPVQVSIDFNA